MEKINCDIIRDLIPSYVDEVCSQATREYVEEHIQSCGECRLIAARLRGQTLAGEKLEQKELDGLKKIRNTLKYQNIICYVLLLFVVFLGILLFFINKYSALLVDQPLPLVVCLLAALAFSAGSRGHEPAVKKDYLLGGFSLAIDIYFMVLFIYTVRRLIAGAETIFGMNLPEIGPFLENQLIAAYFVQTALLFYNFFCIMHWNRNCHWLLCLNLTGVFLLLNYDVWLKYMDNFDTLQASLLRSTFVLIGIGAAGILVCLLLACGIRRKKAAGNT